MTVLCYILHREINLLAEVQMVRPLWAYSIIQLKTKTFTYIKPFAVYIGEWHQNGYGFIAFFLRDH